MMNEEIIYVAVKEDNGIEKIQATGSKETASKWLDDWVKSKRSDGFDAEVNHEYLDYGLKAVVMEAESEDEDTFCVYKLGVE
ncbi:hypothetical protein ACI3E5_06185 [Candidatus Enterococcus avicola]